MKEMKEEINNEIKIDCSNKGKNNNNNNNESDPKTPSNIRD